VAGDAGKTPTLSPTPVAIHDHSDVTGQAVEVDLGQEICFDRFRLHRN
jgi:hypothetical protein